MDKITWNKVKKVLEEPGTNISIELENGFVYDNILDYEIEDEDFLYIEFYKNEENKNLYAKTYHFKDIKTVLSKVNKTLIDLPITCKFCNRTFKITLYKEDLLRYLNEDVLAQRAFPYLTPNDRELIISHTCGECWNKLMKE